MDEGAVAGQGLELLTGDQYQVVQSIQIEGGGSTGIYIYILTAFITIKNTRHSDKVKWHSQFSIRLDIERLFPGQS